MELDNLKRFGLYWDNVTDQHILGVIKEFIEVDEVLIENVDNQILRMQLVSQYDEIGKEIGCFYKIKKEKSNRYN